MIGFWGWAPEFEDGSARLPEALGIVGSAVAVADPIVEQDAAGRLLVPAVGCSPDADALFEVWFIQE
jgi:hypothetical protein